MLTLGQVVILPNVALWAASWMAGPGFGLGEGAAITWSQSNPGLLPLIPGLGAVPAPGPLPDGLWLSALVPVAAGAVVEGTFLCAGNNNKFHGRGILIQPRLKPAFAHSVQLRHPPVPLPSQRSPPGDPLGGQPLPPNIVITGARLYRGQVDEIVM